MSTLSLVRATQPSVTLNVCAGTTGAPAGFLIQWMTKADNDANGWSVDTAASIYIDMLNGNFWFGDIPAGRYLLSFVPADTSIKIQKGMFLLCWGTQQ
jgi:hypothetical protein